MFFTVQVHAFAPTIKSKGLESIGDFFGLKISENSKFHILVD